VNYNFINEKSGEIESAVSRGRDFAERQVPQATSNSHRSEAHLQEFGSVIEAKVFLIGHFFIGQFFTRP
jgi:hypothetical protein